MPSRIIRTPEDMAELVATFSALSLPITVSWVKGADRTTEQNNLQWKWANEAAMQLGDRTAADVQAEWKLEIGVPILRGADDAYRALYDATIRSLPHAMKIKLMEQGYPVTSIMKVRHMVQYMDAVQRQSIGMGLQLTEPDPSLAKYQARHRERADA
jgi:hypothetical protein